ncbi:MAG: hypothetical protein FWD61_14215 [Phycisphaerales bacterium]|nr:hypothetical protein [Phycisphaerales bacterium]
MQHSLTRSRARRDQLLACVLGVVFLAISLLIRPLLISQRASIVSESETSFRSLAVNFPRLTLGGFRGLVATILWIQAENDKQERRWVDLETKYDIIGALQPYFTSVYVFHAWNQAYNLSAQWHDQDDKYKWVLDGLAYLNKGEDYNPQNIDLTVEQGNMFFLKLGGSFERIFYRSHWRSDMARFVDLHNYDQDLAPNTRTEALKLVSDAVFRVPPENKIAYDSTDDPLERQKLRTFHTAELPDPTGRTTRTGYGISILDPYLFELRTDGRLPADPMPFRYGLSPYYFSYVQFVRANWQVDHFHIPPSVTGMRVVDAWPAMSLRLWCRDDLYYATSLVNSVFNGPVPIYEVDFSIPENVALFNSKVAEIRDCYRNVPMVGPKALDQFARHLRNYPTNKTLHEKHILETKAYMSIAKAESALFESLLVWHANRYKLTDTVVKTFTEVLPVYDEAIKATTEWVDYLFPSAPGTPLDPDRAEYQIYINNLQGRKLGIQSILQAQPTEHPSLDFLEPETVER